jgi:hypothetical protein
MARPAIVEKQDTRPVSFRRAERRRAGGPALICLKEPGQVQSQVPQAPDLQHLPAAEKTTRIANVILGVHQFFSLGSTSATYQENSLSPSSPINQKIFLKVADCQFYHLQWLP